MARRATPAVRPGAIAPDSNDGVSIVARCRAAAVTMLSKARAPDRSKFRRSPAASLADVRETRAGHGQAGDCHVPLYRFLTRQALRTEH
jgi:hypothetical protein